MVRKSKLYLTGGTAFLLAMAVSAGAQTPQNPPVPGIPGEGGPQERGRPQVPGRVGAAGGQNRFGNGPVNMPGMMNPMPNMPEMAKKMQTILVLRHLHGFGLSLQDISAVLPSLKTMRDAEKAMTTRSLQILEEEKAALLAAQPDSPLPLDSGQRMQSASETFRQQMNRGWEAITKAVGPEKAGGIRGLIEGNRMMNQPGFGGNPPQQRGVPGQPGQPGQFGNGPGLEGGAPRGRQGGGVPQLPGEAPGFNPAPQEPQPEGEVGFGGQGGGQNRFGGNPPGQPGQRLPGQGQFGANQGRPGMGIVGPQISLTDLVELLEQKQAAMRR